MSSSDLLERLIKEGKIRKQSAGLDYLDGLLISAKRNFDAAALLKGKIAEGAFKLFYDGLLQIGRVILLINGYRPDDGEQHKTTFLVAGELLGKDFAELIKKIQKYRVKRNICLYEPKDLITAMEVDALYQVSKEFWSKARKYLKKRNPQLKLFDDF